jgi:acyl-coenzyme A thioesterase PaaI-like protein
MQSSFWPSPGTVLQVRWYVRRIGVTRILQLSLNSRVSFLACLLTRWLGLLAFSCPSFSRSVSLSLSLCLSVSLWQMTCAFVVSPESLNAGNALFGGLVGSLCDALTTLLHMSAGLLSGHLYNSVSVGLQTEFLASAELGDHVVARVVVDRMGRDFAFTGCDFFLRNDGKLLYRSRHQKKMVSSVELEHLPQLLPQVVNELGRARAALALPAPSARL